MTQDMFKKSSKGNIVQVTEALFPELTLNGNILTVRLEWLEKRGKNENQHCSVVTEKLNNVKSE